MISGGTPGFNSGVCFEAALWQLLPCAERRRHDRSGGTCSCACPQTPSEDKFHEGDERTASRSDIGAYGGDVRIEHISVGEPVIPENSIRAGLGKMRRNQRILLDDACPNSAACRTHLPPVQVAAPPGNREPVSAASAQYRIETSAPSPSAARVGPGFPSLDDRALAKFARFNSRGSARHGPALASSRVSSLLALEIPRAIGSARDYP